MSPETSSTSLREADRISAYIDRHGFAIVVASVLLAVILYVGVFTLPALLVARLEARDAVVVGLAAQIAAHDQAAAAKAAADEQHQRQVITLLMLGCVNGAKSESARELCRQAGR